MSMIPQPDPWSQFGDLVEPGTGHQFVHTDEFPGRDGKSQSLADAVDEADALVSCGQGNIIIHFPPLDKVIGTLDYIETMIGGYEGSLKPDGSIEAELQIIIASTIANGFNHLAARGF